MAVLDVLGLKPCRPVTDRTPKGRRRDISGDRRFPVMGVGTDRTISGFPMRDGDSA